MLVMLNKIKMKQIFKFLLVIALITAGFNSVNAQIIDPVDWKFSAKVINKEEAILYFTANVDQPWHIYTQDPNGGINPTTFTFEKSDAYERIGKVEEPENFIRKNDKILEIDYNLYDHEVIFKQKIKIKNTERFEVIGSINFFSCDDEKCLPPKDEEFKFEINPTSKNVSNNIKSQTENKPQQVILNKILADSEEPEEEDSHEGGELSSHQEDAEGEGLRLLRRLFPVHRDERGRGRKERETRCRERYQASEAAH